MDVVLEMDKKPGLFSEGRRHVAFPVGLNDYQGTDWTAYLNQWLSEVGSKRNWFWKGSGASHLWIQEPIQEVPR